MPTIRTNEHSFNGGEVTPEFYGQIGDAKYQSGLAVCRNFVSKPQGPVENRAGFAFVREVKNSASKARLIPFTFSTTQTIVVELGVGYFRFHTAGATVLSAGVPYEIANQYAAADLFDIHFVQSQDVMTIVHPNYAPMELRRLGATNWTLLPISFAPAISAPTGISATGNGFTVAKYTSHYVVTAIAGDGISESSASLDASVNSNLFETGCTNTVNWGAVAGASRYCVYKQQGGAYGYIGQTNGTSLVDNNIASDLSRTPPTYDYGFQPNGIQSVAVTAGGSGYNTAQSGGAITAVSVTAAGSGYVAPALTVSDPTGSGATFTVVMNAGTIIGVNVNAQGSGYTMPTFVLTDTGGSGAHLVPNVSPIVHASATLQVTDSTGSGAILSPVIVGGVVTAVTILNPGQNYTSPTVSFSASAGGSGATFGAPVLTSINYPGAVSYFEQRRCFAGTLVKPQNIWMTKSGTESTMSYSLPIRDDDRIAFKVAAREANTIRHIVPLTSLLLLTSSGEWRVTSVNTDALTPSSISVKPQSYIGASNVQPVIINNNLLYGAARGGHLREMAYSWQANGYASGDLSLRSPHLFDNFDMLDICYSKAPIPIVWAVSSSGKLLGLTYVPEQQVGSWHWHDTDGLFESCTVVAEGSEDVLYVIVNRTIGGVTKRYVERQATRKFTTLANCFFVDCGATYNGAPATTISGLTWLEGKTVSILADGAVCPQRVVTGGAITLDNAASIVQVGLPITSDMQTLPIAAQIDSGYAQGKTKNVNKVWLRVVNSSGISAGPTTDKLKPYKQRTTEPYGSPPSVKTQEIEIDVTPNWGDGAQIFVRQSDPLPLTLVSMTMEVAIGN